MKKSMLASLMIPALLTGCGSSGSGSSNNDTDTTPVTYTWQVVQLKSVAESSLGVSCIIYDDSTTSGNVITAYKASTDFNILYHNADGSVAETYSSTYFTNGKVTITKSDVPDDGYVSLEEVDGSISADADVYMFSVEKSLLSDLVVNVRQEQSSSTCYTGDDYRDTEVDSDSAVVYANTDYLEYYQTSYDADSIDGKTSLYQIPVASPETPEHDVLVTAYAGYDSDSEQKTDLQYYAFALPSEVYDSTDTVHSDVALNSANEDFNWSYSATSGSTLTVDESTVYALHDDIIYYWQPLYPSSLVATIADASEVSNWSGYFSGSDTYSWDFEGFVAFDADSDTDLSLTIPELYSLSAATIGSDCVIDGQTVENCVDIDDSYSADDFTAQRTHAQLQDSAGNTIYQSIYSPATDTPILLESSQYSFTVSTVDTIEINLINSDATSEDAVQYLMAASMDEVALADTPDSIGAFYDANGFVASGEQRDQLELAMFESTTLTVKNSN